MDIPFVRFAVPCLILYMFYWVFALNPYVDDGGDDASQSAARSQVLLARSKALLREGKLQEALTPTLELHKMYPENHIYVGQLAHIYMSLGRYREEAAMWEKFLQTAPLPWEGCPAIGLAYRHQGLERKAFDAFERCLKLDGGNSDSLFFHGHALERQGQFGRALEMYNRGLQVSPDYPDLAGA